MKFQNIYFVNGTAYAGKSTLVKNLAEKYDGIACGENYHSDLSDELFDKDPDGFRKEFPNLAYMKDLVDWHDFIRRTPNEYETWINGTSKECEVLELRLLEKYRNSEKPVFVDTNISVKTLTEISDKDHVLIMLADPDISVNLFFNRPDKEKQFLYSLILEETDPEAALENFRQCLKRINSKENYDMFLNSGFHVIKRDENRSMEETLSLAEKKLKI